MLSCRSSKRPRVAGGNALTASFGSQCSFPASISPAASGGSVQFLDGTTVLGTVAVSNGATSLSVSTLAVGAHTLSAFYSGDAVDTASTSGASGSNRFQGERKRRIERNPQSKHLRADGHVYGHGLAGRIRDRNVQFYDGGASIGTAA